MPSSESTTLTLLDASDSISGTLKCLRFSPAYNLTGFETMNDKVLKEMNDRARRILTPHDGNTSTRAPQQQQRVDDKLHKFAEITREPPSNRFSAAHSREFAQQPSISDLSPKRNQGSSSVPPESPTKRLRRIDGLGVPTAPASPTKGLAALSLDDQAKVSKAKQIQRREALSPKRRAAYQHQQQQRSSSGSGGSSSGSRSSSVVLGEVPALGFSSSHPQNHRANEASVVKPYLPPPPPPPGSAGGGAPMLRSLRAEMHSGGTNSGPANRPRSSGSSGSQRAVSEPRLLQPLPLEPLERPKRDQARPVRADRTSARPKSASAYASANANANAAYSHSHSQQPTQAPTHTHSHTRSDSNSGLAGRLGLPVRSSPTRSASSRSICEHPQQRSASASHQPPARQMPRSISANGIAAEGTRPLPQPPQLPSYARPTKNTLRQMSEHQRQQQPK